jgi:hypothetical protein
MLAELIPKLAAMEQDGDHPYYPRPSLASPATPNDPGRCVRALVYHRLNTPAAPWPGRFLLVLDDSSWHEELSLDWLRKSAYTVSSCQLPVDFPLPRPLGAERYCRQCSQMIPNTVLHGHIDGIFTDLLGTNRLLEHKAVSMFTFDDLLAGHPPLDYLTQGCIYLGALQHSTRSCVEGLLLVKNKNTSAYCEFRFTYDANIDRCHVVQMVASERIDRTLDLNFDHLITNALAKFDDVEAHATAGTLPPRPYRADHWRCQYCRFSNRCWGGYPAEVEARDATATLDPTVAPLLAQYAEAVTMKHLGEATTKRLRLEILRALETHHTKTGLADGYRATVSVSERTTLDESLLPEDIKQAAQVTKPVETLRITKMQPQTAAD